MKNPTMLYRAPGPHEIHGGKFDYTIVDAVDIDKALGEGWHRGTPAAKAAHEAEIAEKLKATAGSVSGGQTGEAAGGKGEGDDDTKPPTRDELLAKAKELGIEHHPRLGDEKLAALIAEKLKA